jgi:hypothetical protein
MFNNSSKEIDELKTEIVSLKVRIRRLEEFYQAFPNPEDYNINENHPYCA